MFKIGDIVQVKEYEELMRLTRLNNCGTGARNHCGKKFTVIGLDHVHGELRLLIEKPDGSTGAWMAWAFELATKDKKYYSRKLLHANHV